MSDSSGMCEEKPHSASRFSEYISFHYCVRSVEVFRLNAALLLDTCSCLHHKFSGVNVFIFLDDSSVYSLSADLQSHDNLVYQVCKEQFVQVLL